MKQHSIQKAYLNAFADMSGEFGCTGSTVAHQFLGHQPRARDYEVHEAIEDLEFEVLG